MLPSADGRIFIFPIYIALSTSFLVLFFFLISLVFNSHSEPVERKSLNLDTIANMLAMASARAALRNRLPCRRAVSLYVKPTKTPVSSALQVSEEVQEALHGARKRPVVALETTIYTHGMLASLLQYTTS